ncbi:MAG: DUF3035 domain-containing protein [Rhodospirillales bacterium]|nr:DUF3035 domain-containing protein [Rhodospirillales bacterium]
MTAALVALVGCEGVKQDLGIGAKRPPDEFSVYSRAPLSMPPDFGLRPPAGTTAASQAATPRETARQAVLNTAPNAAPAASPGTSPGLQDLLERTGATTARHDIRAQVNEESTILAEADQSLIERLMFWSDEPPPADVVDPAKEARRIQENQALNRPLTTGEIPTIKRKPKALLEGIF